MGRFSLSFAITTALTLSGDVPTTSVIFTGRYLHGILTANGCSSFISSSTVTPPPNAR